MARKLRMVLFSALAAVAFLQSSVSAATYVVGDSSNWAIPSSASAYSNWAANKNFVVGDILVFNFMQNQHDVAEVTKSAHDACNGANPISLQTTSPANFTLRSPGAHHYICSFSGHCSAGQKLSINVAGGAPTPSPQPGDASPSPSPAPSRAPQPGRTSPSPSPTPLSAAPQPSSPAPSDSTPAPSSSATPPSPATPSPTSTTGGTAADTPTTTLAPPPNGAVSLGAAGFTATFLSLAGLALWF